MGSKLERLEVGEETSLAGQREWMRYYWACGRPVLGLLPWRVFIGGDGSVDCLCYSKARGLMNFF